MKETIRIELTQGQYQQLKEVGVSNSEIKSYGCTHQSSGVTIDHYMTVGVKNPITDGAEWKNGDCVEYDNTPEFRNKFKGTYICFDKFTGVHVILNEDGYWPINSDCIRKPETEAERNERERLESAYYLHCLWIGLDGDFDNYSLEAFKCLSACKKWLEIVDKTGYRKAVTNE